MVECTECGTSYRTSLEAKACAVRDGQPLALPSLDFIKMEGHDDECLPFPLRDFEQTFEMELTLLDVNPELLGILTGGVMGTPPPPTFAIDINSPVKRTFWQWLRRKPRQWHHIHIPNATLGEVED